MGAVVQLFDVWEWLLFYFLGFFWGLIIPVIGALSRKLASAS